ncbi:hypothetical protein WAI453_009768 [Rhynchosporium graminicola]
MHQIKSRTCFTKTSMLPYDCESQRNEKDVQWHRIVGLILDLRKQESNTNYCLILSQHRTFTTHPVQVLQASNQLITTTQPPAEAVASSAATVKGA